MPGDYKQFEKRKQDHIQLALMQANQAEEYNAFDQIRLLHEAMPDLNFDEINIASHRFSQPILTPFMVGSMTAGHDDAQTINRHLMAACENTGWAMGVGSQRRELTDKNASIAWKTLRQDYPQVALFSNIGIAQLISTPLSDIQLLIDALQAKAIIIHCNPLQECIQPEGTPNFKGSWKALEYLIKTLSLPVIVKETGCGFSHATCARLNEIGVAAIDVSGLGGTHWGRIEGHRAEHNSKQQQASIVFRNWGIDTVESVRQAENVKGTFEIWGSGGVRNGLDAAKLIALNASTVSLAKPLLSAALDSEQKVIDVMSTMEYELKIAMFCTGSRVLSDLKEKVCL